MTSELESED